MSKQTEKNIVDDFAHRLAYGHPESERISRTPESDGSVSDDFQSCLEFLYDLQGEWGWKRNSIPKNDREMAELDGLIARIKQRLKQNKVITT